MGLIGNYTVLSKNPGRDLGGATVSGERGSWGKSGAARNWYVGSGIDQKVSFPTGHAPGTSWIIAIKPGGLGAMQLILGRGGVGSANLAMGVSLAAALTGTGNLPPVSLSLVVSNVAALTGSGALTGSAFGKLEAAAALTGVGGATGAMTGLASASAALTGTGGCPGNLTGKSSMAADITVTGSELSTANVAAAVWSALASENNTLGTMGGALAAAGAAGDPWQTNLPASYPVGTAGNIIGNLAEHILEHADGIETDVTLQQALRALLASLTGKASGGGGPTITFRNPADTENRVTMTVDENGNRSNVTLNL
jgi:hypothetical protein